MSKEAIQTRAEARTIAAIAASIGEPVDPEGQYDRAWAIMSEANRLGHELRPGVAPVPLPDNPAKVAALVKKIAAERVTLAEQAAVAAELADRAETEIARIAFQQAPEIAMTLRAKFDAAALELASLNAPTELIATSTADDFSAFVSATALSDTMSRLAAYRIQLARAVDDETASPPWLVLAPKAHTAASAIREALSMPIPTTLSGWIAFLELGIGMARPSEAAHRARQFGEGLHNAGLSQPDGGYADRTWGELVTFAGQTPNTTTVPPEGR